MAFLTTHYRKPINWNDALISDSEKKLDRLYGSIRKLGKISPGEPCEEVINAIADDINTPMGVLISSAIALMTSSQGSPGEILPNFLIEPYRRSSFFSESLISASFQLIGLR